MSELGHIFDNESVKLLVKAFMMLENEEECKAFLEDIMTTKEILDISQRIVVAKMLSEQAVYNKIAEETGASTATISRVNRSYSYGTGAYKTVLERLNEKN